MAFGRAAASADAMLDRAGSRPAWIRPIRCGFNRQPELASPGLRTVSGVARQYNAYCRSMWNIVGSYCITKGMKLQFIFGPGHHYQIEETDPYLASTIV